MESRVSISQGFPLPISTCLRLTGIRSKLIFVINAVHSCLINTYAEGVSILFTRALWMMQLMTGALRWSGWKLRMLNCQCSSREPWLLKLRQQGKPERRYTQAAHVLTHFRNTQSVLCFSILRDLCLGTCTISRLTKAIELHCHYLNLYIFLLTKDKHVLNIEINSLFNHKPLLTSHQE